MEGIDSLRKRHSHLVAEPVVTPAPAQEVEKHLTSKGQTGEKMAAGTSRILRYVLLAFFVGLSVVNVWWPRADRKPGCHDIVFCIILINTEIHRVKLRTMEDEQEQQRKRSESR